MTKLRQIRRTETRNKIGDKFILRFLRQSHTEQLKRSRNGALANVMCKTKITSKTQIEILDRKAVKPPIIQTLHSESHNRINLVAFASQTIHQFARQILIEQDFHAAWNSGCWASSPSTPRTASIVRLG